MAGLLVSFTLISSPTESWGQVGPGAARAMGVLANSSPVTNIPKPALSDFEKGIGSIDNYKNVTSYIPPYEVDL
jgi:hypothetical protein